MCSFKIEFNFLKFSIEYLVGLSNINIGCSEERHRIHIVVLCFLNVISSIIRMHFLLLMKLQSFRTVTHTVIIYLIAPYKNIFIFLPIGIIALHL